MQKPRTNAPKTFKGRLAAISLTGLMVAGILGVTADVSGAVNTRGGFGGVSQGKAKSCLIPISIKWIDGKTYTAASQKFRVKMSKTYKFYVNYKNGTNEKKFEFKLNKNSSKAVPVNVKTVNQSGFQHMKCDSSVSIVPLLIKDSRWNLHP